MRIVPGSSAFTPASCHKGIQVSSLSSWSYVRFEVYLKFATPPPPFRTLRGVYISPPPPVSYVTLSHQHLEGLGPKVFTSAFQLVSFCIHGTILMMVLFWEKSSKKESHLVFKWYQAYLEPTLSCILNWHVKSRALAWLSSSPKQKPHGSSKL